MKIEKIILYTVIALALPVIANIITLGNVGIPTFISGLILTYLAYCLYMSKQYENLDGNLILKVWIWMLVIGSVRAFISNYSSPTGLRDSLLSLLNISIVLCVFIGNISNLRRYLTCFFLVVIPCSIFSAFSWDSYGLSDVAHILYPISLFMLIIPYVNKKIKISIVAIALFSFFYDISIRANVLLLIGSFFLLLVFYLSKYSAVIKGRILIWIILLILPFSLLFLGVTGRYNVFKELMSSNIKIEASGSKTRSNYLTDSRTMVYVDVLTSINSTSGWIFGYSPVSKIKTEMAKKNSAYKEGRNSTECGFLNILFQYGIIGILCFLSIIVYSSYLALVKSNNKLVMMVGLFVAFKFFFMFSEEPTVSMTTYFAIGLCLNPDFREMYDEDIKEALSL